MGKHPAQRAREEKSAHPERYCAERNCLWLVMVRSGDENWATKPCENHTHSFYRYMRLANACLAVAKVTPANRQTIWYQLSVAASTFAARGEGFHDHAAERVVCSIIHETL